MEVAVIVLRAERYLPQAAEWIRTICVILNHGLRIWHNRAKFAAWSQQTDQVGEQLPVELLLRKMLEQVRRENFIHLSRAKRQIIDLGNNVYAGESTAIHVQVS